jgi:hypothetical protein
LFRMPRDRKEEKSTVTGTGPTTKPKPISLCLLVSCLGQCEVRLVVAMIMALL